MADGQELRACLLAPFATALLALSACGDGGGVILTPGDDDDDPPAEDCTDTTCGEVRIALTDADGDFLSYTVDVVSIRLERSDGDDVQVLPSRQRVDFAALRDVAEFVVVEDIPNGEYERAVVRLDYGDAEVSVEVDGFPAAAAVVNVEADAVGVVDVDLRLDEAHPLVVASDAPALLQFDFDLEAAHEVNIGTTPVTVTAAPFLIASIEPAGTREYRVRGPIAAVNERAGRYSVDLRPFGQRSGSNGRLRVETTDDTLCEVNGSELDAADCLARLADLPEATLTLAQGDYDAARRRFTARQVLAGSSVPGVRFDTVIGVVAARNLDVVTLSGGQLLRQDGEIVYAQGDIDVTLGAATAVTKDGGSGPRLNFDDVSVGQRIHAFGEASSSDFNPTLDARAGRVRLYPTRLTGLVNGTGTRELRLDLFEIDGREAQFFDFDGTGTSSVTRADFRNYQVDTRALALGDFDAGEGAAAVGFVAPFRSAPPDFVADTVEDFDELPALLGVGWGFAGTPLPFLSMGENGCVIDVANVRLGNRRFLEIGPRRFDIASGLPEPVAVEPDLDAVQRYAIARGLRVELFSDFGDFAARVNSLLRGGSNMQSLTARGTFDVDTTTVVASDVYVGIVAPP